MKKSRDRDIDEEVAKIAASVRSRGWSIAAFSCH
jgi:lambda repressor-like predicted transcriptional regulator